MHIKIAAPVIEAAQEVLRAETGLPVTRGEMELLHSAYTTDEVTVIISLVGSVAGTLVYSLREATAMKLVARLLGAPVERFSTLAQSGIAELGNVIAGRANVALARLGYDIRISPPTLLLGAGTVLSTLDLPRLVVPLDSECGAITLHLALRETAAVAQGASPAAPVGDA